jgi:dTDP-4-dehydrorhamnose reductase
MKIMSIGAGFVSEHLPYETISRRILSVEDVDHILVEHKPDVLVNCIGKTGRPNVDWCESHKEETAFANIAVPIMLAKGCQDRGVHLIQIGSGCIYFGPSPYKGETSWAKDPGWREEDFAKPLSFYSKTKFACDLALGSMDNVATLRIRMPISSQNTQRNFINKIRGYKQIIDIPNSVTFMDDLVRCVDWAARNKITGIYHVTNPEPITAAQVMREYQKYVPEHQFEIISEAELDSLTVAKRSNCIINSDKLKRAGFVMTPSEIALKRCMAEYAKNL